MIEISYNLKKQSFVDSDGDVIPDKIVKDLVTLDLIDPTVSASNAIQLNYDRKAIEGYYKSFDN